DRLHRLLKYNLVSLAGLAVNSGVFYVLNYIRIYYVWSYLIAVLAAFMLNYFGSSRWAWRSVLE
ncbi:MAG: GtrA family protein, partial [Thaumarchaeota archaeon]|nr:GtrA family protein [Nitrososphaerota archaeon]